MIQVCTVILFMHLLQQKSKDEGIEMLEEEGIEMLNMLKKRSVESPPESIMLHMCIAYHCFK